MRVTMTEGRSVFFSAAAIANTEANPVVVDSTTSSLITFMKSHSYFLDNVKLVALTSHLHILMSFWYTC
jgi:hypothetical protein